jgi:hypothetical protein
MFFKSAGGVDLKAFVKESPVSRLMYNVPTKIIKPIPKNGYWVLSVKTTQQESMGRTLTIKELKVPSSTSCRPG